MCLCVVGVRVWLLRAEATHKLHLKIIMLSRRTAQLREAQLMLISLTPCSHWCTAVALKDYHWELIMWPDQLQVYQSRVKAGRGGNPFWCQQHWICNANLNQSCYSAEHFCCICRLRKDHTGWRMCVCTCVFLSVQKKKEKNNIIPI